MGTGNVNIHMSLQFIAIKQVHGRERLWTHDALPGLDKANFMVRGCLAPVPAAILLLETTMGRNWIEPKERHGGSYLKSERKIGVHQCIINNGGASHFEDAMEQNAREALRSHQRQVWHGGRRLTRAFARALNGPAPRRPSGARRVRRGPRPRTTISAASILRLRALESSSMLFLGDGMGVCRLGTTCGS